MREGTLMTIENKRTQVSCLEWELPSDDEAAAAIIRHRNVQLEKMVGAIAPDARVPGVLASAPERPAWLKEIRITQEAYQKAIRASRIAYDMQSSEIYLHLARHKEAPPGLVTDVIVGHEQRATHSHCIQSSTGLFASLEELWKRDLDYAGWCHSHGAYPPFHSSTDDTNLRSLVCDLGIPLLFGEWSERVEYVPSVVINPRDDPAYGAIAVTYRLLGEGRRKTILLKDVPVTVVEESYGISEDIETLRSFITEQVTWGDLAA